MRAPSDRSDTASDLDLATGNVFSTDDYRLTFERTLGRGPTSTNASSTSVGETSGNLRRQPSAMRTTPGRGNSDGG